MTMPDFTLAIMAGGKSSRMGRNKALIKLGQQTILERIIERTANIGQAETLLITNTPEIYQDFGLTMVKDIMPNSGALGGIYTAIRRSKTPYTVVIACDMPFISADLLHLMLSHIADVDAIVPTLAGYPQGLHAIYSQNCIPAIRRRLEQNKLKVSQIFQDLKVTFLDETLLNQVTNSKIALMNVNTPADLLMANELISDDTST